MTEPPKDEVNEKLLELLDIGEQKDYVDDMISKAEYYSPDKASTISIQYAGADGVDQVDFLLPEAVPAVMRIIQEQLADKRQRLIARAKELMK